VNYVKNKVGCRKHCSCKKGYSGVPCDFGPRYSNFNKLSTEAKALSLLAAEACVLAYISDPKKLVQQCPSIHSRAKGVHVEKLTGTGHNYNIRGVTDAGIASGVHHSGVPFVVFRGTDSVATIVQDLMFMTTTTYIAGKKVLMHRGFYHAIKKNWHVILKHVRRVIGNKRRILISGHSLGGGMATIATAMLKPHFRHVTFDLISVAAPRAGDSRLVRLVEQSTRMCYRLVNAQYSSLWAYVSSGVRWDVVTTLPKGLTTAMYMHAGTQINMGIKDGTKQAGMPVNFMLHPSSLYLERVRQLVGKKICAKSMCPHAHNMVCSDNDACLQGKPGWGKKYTCAHSTKYCKSYASDMKCCPKSCGTCRL